jgi:GNAT superfamily N-acetyltransferase
MNRNTLSALDCNFLEASRIFVASSERGEYRERRDVAVCCCGLPAESLNWGFLKPPYADAGATAEAVRSYFAERKLPFNVTFRDEDPRPVLERLESSGWRRKSEPTPGMALSIPRAIPAAPEGLSIAAMRTPEELVAFREAAFRGFGYPLAVARFFLSEPLLAMPHVRMYAGLVDGVVVATSMLIATGSVAGIYWVATLDEQRGRGYGAALTWAAVEGGRALGCELASLQASQLGRPVYTRMGFAHVLDYEHLLPPET